MIVVLKEKKIVSSLSVSPKEAEVEQALMIEGAIQTDFEFTESLDLYMYDGKTFHLIDGWEAIKAKREEEAYLASLPSFEELKEQKEKDVRAFFQEKIDMMRQAYAPYEIESFTDQREEWKAWKQNTTNPTPIIDALSHARGISKENLMGKIEKNVLDILSIQGQQNKIEDALKACENIEELNTITWE